MIVLDFMDQVWQSAAREGTPFISFTTERDKFLDFCWRRLNVYASRTGCIQSDNVAFTPIVGQRTYPTINNRTQAGDQLDSHQTNVTYLAVPMCDVSGVFINGSPLRVAGDELGRVGKSSEVEVARTAPGYLTAANGLPAYWFQKSPNTLCFNCPFDQAYANSWLQGKCYHTPLTVANGGDYQVLDLPPEDIDLAAEDASCELLRPLNRAIAIELRKMIDARMIERMGDCTDKSAGMGIRRTGSREEQLDLRC